MVRIRENRDRTVTLNVANAQPKPSRHTHGNERTVDATARPLPPDE